MGADRFVVLAQHDLASKNLDVALLALAFLGTLLAFLAAAVSAGNALAGFLALAFLVLQFLVPARPPERA